LEEGFSPSIRTDLTSKNVAGVGLAFLQEDKRVMLRTKILNIRLMINK
jgi:hypothetical protein